MVERWRVTVKDGNGRMAVEEECKGIGGIVLRICIIWIIKRRLKSTCMVLVVVGDAISLEEK